MNIEISGSSRFAQNTMKFIGGITHIVQAPIFSSVIVLATVFFFLSFTIDPYVAALTYKIDPTVTFTSVSAFGLSNTFGIGASLVVPCDIYFIPALVSMPLVIYP